MPATYEPIASTTLGSDAASVTISNLPGTFTDLVMVATALNDTATVYGLRLRFNGDTGSNYSSTFVFGDGSSAGSDRISNETLGLAVGNTSPSTGDAALSVIHVFSYANTNVFKTALNAGARPASAVARNVGLWRSTAAITSVEFLSSTGNIKSGSTFSVYGIKAA